MLSGFSTTIELRAARPPWGVPAVAALLLLAACAVLISDLSVWLRLAVVAMLLVASARSWRALRSGSIAPGVAALWYAPPDEWRLILDSGELERAWLLRRRSFVTRAMVGLTLRRERPGQGGAKKLKLWLTPAMLSAADWRRLQVWLRNP